MPVNVTAILVAYALAAAVAVGGVAFAEEIEHRQRHREHTRRLHGKQSELRGPLRHAR